MRRLRHAGLLLLVALAACSKGELAPDVQRVAQTRKSLRCDHHSPNRRVFFGDLHIHTALSVDAYTFDTRAGVDDAYRFARGEEILMPPLDAAGRPTLPIRIDRPLDFAAVTDHSESFGSTALCTRPGSPVYESPSCRLFRSGRFVPGDIPSLIESVVRRSTAVTSAEVCGANGDRCAAAAVDPWLETIAAAAQATDRSSACQFTAFAAYEYSNTPEFTKIHRNVIFRGDATLPVPISSTDEPDVRVMWRRLREECIEAETGCDVLAIPHNPNLSNGHMFAAELGGDTHEERVALARLRASLEPLLEMTQIKGDSECRNGLWKVLGGTDELCDYEKYRAASTEDCQDGTGQGALRGEGCVSRLDYARYAAIEGIRQQAELGVNPFKVGFMGSTDTHDANPGDTAEWMFDGVKRLDRGDLRMNPGGLIAVWAEQNRRSDLFDAMRRREAYGTSGSRMEVRFFGGVDADPGLCERPDLVERAYATGVPMGGDLPTSEGPPSFVVAALRDPGGAWHPGTPLQRAQVIKGWVGDDDAFHQAVYEVAGTPDNGADVDLDTCTPRGPGHDRLCGVWTDPDFDPEQGAVYYARVVENPSCRFSTYLCQRADPRPAACDDPALPATIQERAWTSPIWYTPPG
jgi:hypothetical protein